MLMNRRDFLVKGGVVVGTSLIPNTALAVFGSSVRGTMGAAGAAGAAGGDVTSYVFDGTGDYLSIPDHADWAFEGSDWAIEAFIKLPSIPLSAANAIVTNRSGGGARWQFVLDVDVGLRLYINDNTNTLDISQGDMSGWEQGVWYHVIASCSGNDFEVFRDGVSLASTTDATITFPDTSNLLTIGVYNQASLGSPFDGYIDEVRISVGTDRGFTGGSPTVPTSQYSSDSNTKLLIHGGEAYTGALTGETTQSCVTLDGTGDYLSVPDHADWDFAASDFTIEFFVKSGTAGRMVASRGVLNGGSLAWFIHDDTTNIRFRYSTNGSDETNVDAAINLNDDVFTHIAIVRESTSLKIYENGTEKVDHNISTSSIHDPSAPVLLGCRNENATGISSFMDGGFAEIRISNTARWSTGFTPSTTRYTSDANTKLLIHGDENGGGTAAFTDSGNTGHTVTPTGDAFLGNGGIFTDSGNTGHTVTENGNAQRETEQEFKFADDGVGYYFDGANDSLTMPDHADWAFSSSNFTFECWVRFDSITTQYFVGQYYDSDNRYEFWFHASNGPTFHQVTATSVEINENVGNIAGWKPNTWYHVALIRGWSGNANDYAITRDGVVLKTFTNASTIDDHAAVFSIGSTTQGSLGGYMDEIRISDNARWTADFSGSLPSAQHSSDGNTLALIHCGETKTGTTGSQATFTESSSNARTVTEVNNSIESTGNFYKF